MALELRNDRVATEPLVAEQLRRIRIRASGLFAVLNRGEQTVR
jgi:hypothetical protein